MHRELTRIRIGPSLSAIVNRAAVITLFVFLLTSVINLVRFDWSFSSLFERFVERAWAFPVLFLLIGVIGYAAAHFWSLEISSSALRGRGKFGRRSVIQIDSISNVETESQDGVPRWKIWSRGPDQTIYFYPGFADIKGNIMEVGLLLDKNSDLRRLLDDLASR